MQMSPNSLQSFPILLFREVSQGAEDNRSADVYTLLLALLSGATIWLLSRSARAVFSLFERQRHLVVAVRTGCGTWRLLSPWDEFESMDFLCFGFFEWVVLRCGWQRSLLAKHRWYVKQALCPFFFFPAQTLAICLVFLDVWQPRQSVNSTWACRCLTELLLLYFMQFVVVINEQ